MESERDKAIALAVSTIEKQFGKGAILTMSEDGVDREVESFSSGSPSIDLALGIGGYPRGRVVEIFGPESSGKTTLALHAVAEVQRRGGVAAFVDAEHALDIGYARRLGVQVEDLLVSQPDTGEQALEIVDVLLRSGAIDLVVVDSVAALVPRAEIEGEMGDQHMGLQARLMSQALRKLTGTVSKSRATVIFINQIRMKIGVMFGNPETTSGGNALKFYASVRLDVRRIAAIKEGDEVIGNRTRVKVVKNKMAPPFRQAEFDILYNRGISIEGDLLDLGVECGIVEKSGAWLSFEGERIGQGRENARKLLLENPDVRARLADAVYAAKGIKRQVPAKPEAVEAPRGIGRASKRAARRSRAKPENRPQASECQSDLQVHSRPAFGYGGRRHRSGGKLDVDPAHSFSARLRGCSPRSPAPSPPAPAAPPAAHVTQPSVAWDQAAVTSLAGRAREGLRRALRRVLPHARLERRADRNRRVAGRHAPQAEAAPPAGAVAGSRGRARRGQGTRRDAARHGGHRRAGARHPRAAPAHVHPEPAPGAHRHGARRLAKADAVLRHHPAAREALTRRPAARSSPTVSGPPRPRSASRRCPCWSCRS